jgi:hypothetical protein
MSQPEDSDYETLRALERLLVWPEDLVLRFMMEVPNHEADMRWVHQVATARGSGGEQNAAFDQLSHLSGGLASQLTRDIAGGERRLAGVVMPASWDDVFLLLHVPP